MDNKIFAHTTWNCKYHILFAPKYRRQAIYGLIKEGLGRILRQLCERKGVEIIEATACTNANVNRRIHINLFFIFLPYQLRKAFIMSLEIHCAQQCYFLCK